MPDPAVTPLRPIAPPCGYLLRKQTDCIAVGDLLTDPQGKWRGPLTGGPMVGKTAAQLNWSPAFACRPVTRR